MKNKNGRSQGLRFLLLYTVLFALCAVLAFHYFPASGKRMVWKGDGLSQHYVALCYYARWGKAVLRSILAGQPSFPTLNLHMGLGADLFTTLQYYVIGDPFSLPAVFVPAKYMLDFHDAMILLRMYLAGICFACYCRAMGHRDLWGTTAGTLVYVFSTFSLFGMRHPYFLNAMIWFPLLLLGAEHIFRGKKGRLFTAAVFFSCISNFYFFYMLAVMSAVYVIWRALRIRLFPVLRAGGQGKSLFEPLSGALRDLCLLAVRFLARAVLGVAMGAVFLLPVLLRFVQDPRVSGGTSQDILYALSYYAKIPEAFLAFGTDQTLEYWTCMGFGALGLIAVLLLFLNAESRGRGGHRGLCSDRGGEPVFNAESRGRGGHRGLCSDRGREPVFNAEGPDRGMQTTFYGKGPDRDREQGGLPEGEKGGAGGGARRHTDLKAAFLFLLLLVLLPFGGVALNGFSYPANRWTWAFAMLAGYIAAVMLPSLAELSLKKTAVLLALLAVYGLVCRQLGAAKSTLAELALAMAVVLAVRALSAAGAFLQKRKAQGPGAGKASGAGPAKDGIPGKENGGAVSPPQDRAAGKEAREEAGSSFLQKKKAPAAAGGPAGLVLLGAAVLTVAVHARVEFVSGRENSSLREYHTDRYIAAMAASDAAGMRSLFGNTAFYRYSARDLANNFSLLHDVSNTQYYWSLSDGGVTRFFTETGQGNGMVHLYDNMDNRTMVDEIAGVKYYKRSDGSLLPFGYEKVGGAAYDNRDLFEDHEDHADDPFPVFSFSVYENRYALPVGFSTDRYVTRKTYDALSIPERQEALMQGVLLEEEGLEEAAASGALREEEGLEKAAASETLLEKEGLEKAAGAETLREAALSFTEKKVPYTARAEDGIDFLQMGDGSVRILVRDTGKALYLEAEDPEDLSRCEISVLFTGMEYKSGMPEPDYENTEPVEITVTAKRKGETVSKKTISYTLADNPWKTGRSDFLSCCGYAEKAPDQVRLKFSRTGLYTFGELALVGQPMEAYPAQVQALREYTLEDLDLHELPDSGAAGKLTGRITVPDTRLLCLQIPYLQGLRGYVDGEEQPLLRADTMFCALVLEPGTHEIELCYRTPGLAAGAAVSLAALLLFLLEIAADKMRGRRR